jgi:DNA-directed RNA polymerase subunit RPC12/RpoP
MVNFLSTLFQCRHKRCTFPITRKPGEQRSGTAAVTGTYYVCLDCGTEFAYDWQTMEVVETQRSGIRARRLVEGKAAQKAS